MPAAHCPPGDADISLGAMDRRARAWLWLWMETPLQSSACHCPPRLAPTEVWQRAQRWIRGSRAPHLRSAAGRQERHLYPPAPLTATLPLNLALCPPPAAPERAGQSHTAPHEEITGVSGSTRDRRGGCCPAPGAWLASSLAQRTGCRPGPSSSPSSPCPWTGTAPRLLTEELNSGVA